jgi:hypothetical protein
MTSSAIPLILRGGGVERRDLSLKIQGKSSILAVIANSVEEVSSGCSSVSRMILGLNG